MSDNMFNELIDDVFVQEDVSDIKQDMVKLEDKYGVDEFADKDEEINSDRIAEYTKEYMNSNASKDNKLSFLKLKNQYLIIKNIYDYEDIEKKLYKNKSRIEIVKFEISRIIKNMDGNEKVSEQIANIEKLLQMYNGNLSDDLYKRIINLIIKIELLLDMKIGLFSELCVIFENEMNRIKKIYFNDDKKSNVAKENDDEMDEIDMSYSRKK